MIPHLMGGDIDFDADPVGVSITLSCLHNILWTGGWIPTKFSWLGNWDKKKKKKWLDFSDLDLIFKVTAVQKLKIHGRGDPFSLWEASVFSDNTVTRWACTVYICHEIPFCIGMGNMYTYVL